MYALKDRVALVTGGTAGIGEAVVRLLSSEGASVVFTGNNVDAGATLTQETGAHFIKHDVTDVGGWAAVADELKRKGRLDIAFVNAGTNTGDSNIEDITPKAWSHIFDVNVTGAMLTCKTAIDVMKNNPEGATGSIIINSSVTAMVGLSEDVTYTATKGALRSFAKSVAVYCGRMNYPIRCNSIHPGITETPNITKAISEADDPAAARTFLENAAVLKRFAQPREIAEFVLYLGSDRASFITGAELVIDGGSTIGFAGV